MELSARVRALVLALFVSYASLPLADTQRYPGDSCTTKKGAPGTCTSVQKCPQAQRDLLQGLSPEVCSFDGFDPVVCCVQTAPATSPLPPTSSGTSSAPTKPNTPATPTTPETNAKTGSKSLKMCADYARFVWRIDPGVGGIPDPTASMRNVSLCKAAMFQPGVPFVVGGDDADLFEFPHMAAVGFGEKGKELWRCGGTLISPNFVLTAAHCLEDYRVGRARWVRLGDHNLHSSEDLAKPQDFQVTQRIAYPGYSQYRKYRDIGLLRLDRNAVFNEAVRPACLHVGGPQEKQIQGAVATGWGAIRNRGPASESLQKVTLNIMDQERCKAAYDPVANPVYKTQLGDGIVDEMLCAGGDAKGEKDTCGGDSGGPLQVLQASPHCTYSIIGITSFGRECASPNIPGVYTRVSSYVPWIESIVWATDTNS